MLGYNHKMVHGRYSVQGGTPFGTRGPVANTNEPLRCTTPVEPNFFPSSPLPKVHIAVCSKVLRMNTSRLSAKTEDPLAQAQSPLAS